VAVGSVMEMINPCLLVSVSHCW